MSIEIPRMMEVRQNYRGREEAGLPCRGGGTVCAGVGVLERVKPGMRIAVGVGSRVVAKSQAITRATVENVLKRAGAEPFVIPAMGSHGGATPGRDTGDPCRLRRDGRDGGRINCDRMDVKLIGTAFDGHDGREVVFSAAALEADAVVPINRVKPPVRILGSTLGSGHPEDADHRVRQTNRREQRAQDDYAAGAREGDPARLRRQFWRR